MFSILDFYGLDIVGFLYFLHRIELFCRPAHDCLSTNDLKLNSGWVEGQVFLGRWPGL